MPVAARLNAHPLLLVRRLTKSYREGESTRTLFTALDLQVARGERIALLGRSGSGKSTLLNLISGIDRPDQGEVIIDGTVLNRLSEHERTLFRRTHIGFVFQFFNLIATLNVLENLLLPLELQGRLTPGETRRAEDLLDQVGLRDRATAFPDRLSGGEQQRIAIARALIHQPRLLLADEPTGNLDSESGAQALELLDALVREQGATLILVTHSAEVARRADRILTIRDGRIESSAP
ncbi:ABC transporter ATP-binding protein [Geoalkalibacter halelectricus]|uniref:ABC transporter ATP-binding protein n=1 Tax=Geoalkalibacter halelectricus TaxID=2847045 RepID=A0ABY5ZPB1_9BACT|nr:ABC transporter ATP-binding protein [Geoalkalibacter halelectricus]MDO3377578.1 ABC transporter ATP-binding protein [Geoalkalibacter halelectricus]UWZ80664.1 ABC transporter ATP-binding protein [Geoalkalibacter halelectricus]